VPKPRPFRVGTTNEAARHAWVRDQLARLPAGWRILDAGAGEQQYRKFCGHLRYVSQDFGQYKPDESPHRGTGLQVQGWAYGKLDYVCDITAIPEPDGSFDVILCTEVFEHIPDPPAAVREFARLLRPGGELILTAPFCSLTHFAPYHFATGFSRYWYEHHLPANGFDLAELTPNGNYFEFAAQEVRRLPSVAERFAAGRAGVAFKVLSRLFLLWLGRWSARDRGSSELLAFGWNVRAVRRGGKASG
jgi:SAM-dependent methyltransferase